MTAKIEWGQTYTLPGSSVLGRFSWEVAMLIVKHMGEGWRLPTKEELHEACELQMADYHNSHFLCEESLYWSGDECPDTRYAFGVFYERVKGRTFSPFHKGRHQGLIKPVRDIT